MCSRVIDEAGCENRQFRGCASLWDAVRAVAGVVVGASVLRKCLKCVRDATVAGGKGRRTGWIEARALTAIESTPRGRAMGDTADRPVILQSVLQSLNLYPSNPQPLRRPSGSQRGRGIGRVDAACRRRADATLPSRIRKIQVVVISG